MAKSNDLADTIRRIARQYQDMVEIGALLDQHGSLDNAIAEAKAALVQAQKERDAGFAEVQKVMLDLKTTSANHKIMLDNISIETAKLLAAAKAAAQLTITQAEAKAAKLVVDADTKVKAEAAKLAMAADVQVLRADAIALRDESETLKAAISTMTVEAEVAEKRLAKIKADIAKLVATA